MKLRALAWLILAVGMIWCRAAFVEDVILNIDEAEYAVAADALDHGWLPGVDLLGSTKPPGIVLLYKLLFLLFGRSIAVVHAAHIVILIAAGVLLVELAVALWDQRAAVPAAVLFWMVANSYAQPHEIAALNVEPPGIALVLGGLLLAWKKARSRWAIFAAGVLLGLAALIRQSFGIFLLPLWGAMNLHGEKRLSALIPLTIGFILPWIPITAWYGAAGGLGWAWDSWVRYPLTYSADAGIGGFLQGAYTTTTSFLVEALIPAALLISGAVVLWRERRQTRTRFLGGLCVASLIALFSGSRFFGHYWIQAFPAVALFGVAAWRALTAGGRKSRVLLMVAVGIGCIIAAARYPTWRSWDRYAPPRGVSFYALGTEQAERSVGDFAREHTTPDETIAVWGYCPQIYYHAQRLPGVRDYLCHYVTGYSPGTFDPLTGRAIRRQGHPQAQEMFIADLQRRRPKYVFDLWQIDNYTFTFFSYPVSSYPQLASYLRAHYLPDGEMDRVLVYRRRTAADTWWPSENEPQ
jgi:4-amino-4-deoxy-L-arabinose transferase-like glycosyltransferase